ncbi:MAG: hypothetical protein JRN26_06840 [Nitrososphaerota archaeon]|jgi:hypothetical protein|nr:hypothetical protein [Nitrososphaerota archaeon]MDG6930205.1 hypothetical protein [Nitrososphaerota archaeon]MDG6933018.1 hypothetical protein [Nitrososphaerota archaeon]MDG6936577.1 hypothetical protein [Nitrososphaerota archaeon]MDG6943570.1 hypothetical protein [Nitrososphaerota archaeon]
MDKRKIGSIVESAIADYGGDVTKGAVMWHLEHTYSLGPEDAILKPEKFLRALRDIYGDFVSIIEGNICEKLAKEYGIDYKGEGLLKLAEEMKVG